MSDKTGQLKDRCYLLNNPISKNDDALYIMHNRTPRFIAEVVNAGNNNITITIVLNIDPVENHNIESKIDICRRYIIAYYESLKNTQ